MLNVDFAFIDLIPQPRKHVLNSSFLLLLHALVEGARICDHLLQVERIRVVVHYCNCGAGVVVIEGLTYAQRLRILWIL